MISTVYRGSPTNQNFRKMEISDMINWIDRIRSNPEYPVNPIRRFD